MTNLTTLFKQIRHNYLAELRKEIETYNQTFEHTAAEELIEHVTNQSLPSAFQLHRVDMVSNSHNYTDYTEFQSKNTVFFRPRVIKVNKVTELKIEPFLWHEVDIECSNVDLRSRLIQNWVFRWINEQGIKEDCPFALKGCVHGIMIPPTKAEVNRFSVDLGSAKETALIELLHILIKQKAQSIRVYSRSLYI